MNWPPGATDAGRRGDLRVHGPTSVSATREGCTRFGRVQAATRNERVRTATGERSGRTARPQPDLGPGAENVTPLVNAFTGPGSLVRLRALTVEREMLPPIARCAPHRAGSATMRSSARSSTSASLIRNGPGVIRDSHPFESSGGMPAIKPAAPTRFGSAAATAIAHGVPADKPTTVERVEQRLGVRDEVPQCAAALASRVPYAGAIDGYDPAGARPAHKIQDVEFVAAAGVATQPKDRVGARPHRSVRERASRTIEATVGGPSTQWCACLEGGRTDRSMDRHRVARHSSRTPRNPRSDGAHDGWASTGVMSGHRRAMAAMVSWVTMRPSDAPRQ